MVRMRAILSRQKIAATTGLLFIVLLATSARPAAAVETWGHSGLELIVAYSSTEATVNWVLNENAAWYCEPTEYRVTILHLPDNSYHSVILKPASDPLSVTVSGLESGHLYLVEVAVSRSKGKECWGGHRRAMFTALDTLEPPATNTPLPTATSEPTATSTPLPTVTPEPIATATSELIGPVGKVVETAGDPTGSPELETELPATPHVTTEKLPPFKVRNLDVTPAGTHVTVTWKKAGTGKQHPQRCRTADPQQYRYKVVLWTGAVGDKSDREEVVDHTETSARVVELTGLTSGTQYAALVQSYSAECDNWAKAQRVIWTQP